MKLSLYKSKFTALLKILLFSKLTDEDVAFIREYLTKQEQILFYALSSLDQRHSLNVAYTIREWLGKKPKMREDKLYKAALLHDIGKARSKLYLRDRIKQVLLFTFMRPLADYLADRGAIDHKGYWRRILYVYKYHPRLGANLARSVKIDDSVAYLIENHHIPERQDEPRELTLLRDADELN